MVRQQAKNSVKFQYTILGMYLSYRFSYGGVVVISHGNLPTAVKE